MQKNGKKIKIEIRYPDKSLHVTTLIVDRKFSLLVELNDTTKDNFLKQSDWQDTPLTNQLFVVIVPFLRIYECKQNETCTYSNL